MTPDVSVIIINYKTSALAIECINSVFSYTNDIDFEVIVVDNASGDDSIKRLKDEYGDKITVVPSEKNLGFGKGNNLGAQNAAGRNLLFLNPDTYLLNNAIKLLSDYLDHHENVGIAGGNLYFPDYTPAPSYCSDFDTPESEKKNASWRSILCKKIKSKFSDRRHIQVVSGFNYSDESIPVSYVFGADMMIKRELFERIGGFDPEFFMYAEEAELSWRINQLGYKIVNVPSAKIVHLEGASTSGSNGFNTRQTCMRMNGKLIYYKKCFGIEGMETFYNARHLQYQRLLKIAEIRGKDITQTDTYKMLECLECEYQKYKSKMKEEEQMNG